MFSFALTFCSSTFTVLIWNNPNRKDTMRITEVFSDYSLFGCMHCTLHHWRQLGWHGTCAATAAARRGKDQVWLGVTCHSSSTVHAHHDEACTGYQTYKWTTHLCITGNAIQVPVQQSGTLTLANRTWCMHREQMLSPWCRQQPTACEQLHSCGATARLIYILTNGWAWTYSQGLWSSC